MAPRGPLLLAACGFQVGLHKQSHQASAIFLCLFNLCSSFASEMQRPPTRVPAALVPPQLLGLFPGQKTAFLLGWNTVYWLRLEPQASWTLAGVGVAAPQSAPPLLAVQAASMHPYRRLQVLALGVAAALLQADMRRSWLH